jgi:hypothetical protein
LELLLLEGFLSAVFELYFGMGLLELAVAELVNLFLAGGASLKKTFFDAVVLLKKGSL